MRRSRRPKVYFVEREGYIKIGTTTHLKKRLRDLACVGVLMPPGVKPGPVNLLLVVRGTARKERWLHQRFAKHHVIGEWFHSTPDLVAYIDELKERDDAHRRATEERPGVGPDPAVP